MRTRIEIHDTKDGILTFDLVDILEIININIELEWEIVDIEINALEEYSKEESELFQKVEKGEIKFFTQERLMEMTKSKIQVINGEILGNRGGITVVIKVIDSSYWEVTTNLQWLIDSIQETFKNILIQPVIKMP